MSYHELTNRTDVGKQLERMGNYILEQLQKRHTKISRLANGGIK
jgi:hypothetical protein